VPSPNIWHHPETYELENRSVDRDGLIEAAMREVFDWSGQDVVDIGCGSGFHLPRWAADAGSVTGVEPHPGLVRLARRRTSRRDTVTVLQGAAQSLPLPDSSADMTHARWAYFFGPGCEAGLVELARVLRRGGVAFVVDNDATRSTFGSWFRRGYPEVDPVAVERFWSMHGWTRRPVDTSWRFAAREELEAVVRVEFPAEVSDRILSEHTGLEVDYAVSLWWRRY
jgi:ubiquinone/menaquinone biosynthesis C-methylase UbiE